jgi:glycosyltransferase involved in cell wall biosynthesis
MKDVWLTSKFSFMGESIRRKILIVTDAWKPQVNGVVRTYEHLAEELRALGCELRIIGPADFPHRMPLPGYSEIELALFPYRRLSRLIDAELPATLHIGTEGPLGWAAHRYAVRKGLSFTTAYHTQFPDYVARRFSKHLPILYKPVRGISDFVLRRFHKPSSGIVTTTISINEDLRRRGYQTPLYQLPRGVPTDLFSPGDSPLFRSIRRPLALYVGRVAIEKNIAAFLSMAWAGSKVVVGDGPSLNALKKKFPDVIFTGRKTGAELADHYRAADVFVFPSRTDTFGIVLIEALASGLPVAAYNVFGPRDIITQSFLGVLGDDLAQAARQALALQNDSKRRHEWVQEHYSWPAIAQRFLEILSETKT